MVKQTYAPRALDQKFVDRLPFDSAPYLVRDTKVKGLMLAVNKASKSWKVQRDLYRGERGARKLVKTVRHTLGTVDQMKLDDARTRALEVIAMIKRGEDPNERRETSAADADASGWTVRDMFDHYAEDMRQRECRDRSIADMLYRRDRYLTHWLTRAITSIRKNEARAEHKRLSTDHGKRTANQVMKDFRWAYNLALKIVEDADALGDNPTNAITWNKERASERFLSDEELPEWWAKVDALNNPIRRTMHQFGLLSGLRPGTLMTLRREWVRLDARCVSIPRMKADRAFDLPLSPPMVAILNEALAAGETLFGKADWVFPTRARTQQMKVIATNVVKEKTLPSQTGHILRHTYRTKAKAIGLDDIDARLLLDHTVPGIDGVYLHKRGLFDRLLNQQERMSEALLAFRRTPPPSE